MMNPITIGDATLYCGDNREILPALGRFDALVTDPPYGIGEAAGKNKNRGGFNAMRGKSFKPRDYGSEEWDNQSDPDGVSFARSISDWQIIFGGNYYELPPTPCWLVWDKINNGNFADCELAWTNLKGAVRRINWLWDGFRQQVAENRVHPTQKPLGVMTWCIERLPSSVETILDPYAGSGTTGVAAIRMGKKFTGIERLPKYFDIMCRRIEEAYRQPADLFIEPPATKPKQEALL